MGTETPAASTLTVRLRLFGRYAEVLGRSDIALTMPAGATVGDAVAQVRSTDRNGSLLPEHPLAAVNLEHVAATRTLRDGDELALLPPLAGG